MAARRRSIEPPAEPALSRTAIVSAALELMDTSGVDGFSMRKLAARLSVSPQALYWHFENKDDLCRAVVQLVREDMPITLDPALPLVEGIRALMRAMRSHLARHPSATELGRRFFPPMAGEVTDTGVELIRALGITDPDEALKHYRALVWTVTGFALVEHGAHASVHHRLVDPASSTYEVRLRSDAGEPLDGSGFGGLLSVDELFEAVINVFVSGLEVVAASRS
jgi:AcrR family transcriptional regulator